jgi:hypothetical protein
MNLISRIDCQRVRLHGRPASAPHIKSFGCFFAGGEFLVRSGIEDLSDEPNCLFADRVKGINARATLYSLVSTERASSTEPYAHPVGCSRNYRMPKRSRTSKRCCGSMRNR